MFENGQFLNVYVHIYIVSNFVPNEAGPTFFREIIPNIAIHLE